MAKKKKRDVGATLAKIRDAVKSIQIADVRLVDSACTQRLRDGHLPEKLEYSIETEGRHVKQHSLIFMFHQISLEGKYDEVTEDLPFGVNATFNAQYKVTGDIGTFSDKDISVFARAVSLFHVWPYWREFVQNTTARMGLPPLTVPLYRPGGFDSATVGNKELAPSKAKTTKKASVKKTAKKATKRPKA